MKNVYIEALTEEHGANIIEFFIKNGARNFKRYNGSSCKNNNNDDRFYYIDNDSVIDHGCINSVKHMKQLTLPQSIIILPEDAKLIIDSSEYVLRQELAETWGKDIVLNNKIEVAFDLEELIKPVCLKIPKLAHIFKEPIDFDKLKVGSLVKIDNNTFFNYRIITYNSVWGINSFGPIKNNFPCFTLFNNTSFGHLIFKMDSLRNIIKEVIEY